MKTRILGKSNLPVSTVSFGASSLGGVFKEVDYNGCIETVHAALDAGINYFDVAPAYGATVAETVLGKALQGIDRKKYFLSTKAGKYTIPDDPSQFVFDYTEEGIRKNLDESMKRLGVDYLDIIHLHDYDYEKGRHSANAFATGFPTLVKLKEEGVIGAVGAGIYDMSMWRKTIQEAPVDVLLMHNHYCLNDTLGIELHKLCQEKNIGIINASPFASSLLTPGPVPEWHPASPEDRNIFQQAAEYCRSQGSSIAKLAMQFSVQQELFATTMFSTSRKESLQRNIKVIREPIDKNLLHEVSKLLGPVMNKQWVYENTSGK